MFQRCFQVICGFLLAFLLLFTGILPSWAAPTADLSNVSFSQLPAINSNGSLQTDGIDRQWQAGQTPDQFLTLGDIQSLQPEAMSIDTISQVTGQQLAATGIGDFQPLAEQDVNSLLTAAPTLGQLQVKDVPALESLFGEKAAGVVDPKTLSSGALEQVVKQFPSLGDLKLNAIDMNRFAINSLPGVSNLPIGQLPNWQNSPISGVPGMGQVPMGSFPNSIGGGGSTMRIDFVHGPEEAERLNTISGSDVEGFRVPCKIGRKDCAYIEMDDDENEGVSAQSRAEGVQWISGKYQEVKGGKGALKLVNGGKEPTGRLPYGDVFKVVVWEPDEKTDTVTTALFTRFCRDKANCTPYFIGPIPHLVYRRDSKIFVGKLDLGAVPSQSSTPTGAKKGGPMPAMKTYNGGGGGGKGQTCTVDPSKLDGATKAAIAATDPASQEGAANMVPFIMNACAKAGVTDADQLAYILATAEHETDHFNTMREYDQTPYDSCGAGEGMIQVTWCENKQKVFQELGLPAYGGVSDKRLQDPTIAADALCRGMKEGWYGQGRPIAECIGGGKIDYLCARQQVNANDRWEEIGAKADSIKAGLGKGGGAASSVGNAVTCQPTNGTSGGSGAKGKGVTAGPINQRILQTAQNLKGQIDTSAWGGNGCMVAVNEVMKAAGLQPFMGDGAGTNITAAINDCQGGRCTEVSEGDAQPGDILIVDDGVERGHIGVCTSAGCSQSLSNSSSQGNFVWQSDGWFSESYGNTGSFRRYIFRVNQ